MVDYPFVKTDAGRSFSKRKKQKNDCTVRAVALVMAVPYDTAYDHLRDLGRDCSRGFSVPDFADDQPDLKPLPVENGMTLGKFLQEHPKGTHMVTIKGHVFGIVDGTVFDTFTISADTEIRQAWKVQA